jgi:hypothetical protein
MTRRAWTILGAGCAALALALALGPSDVPAHSESWHDGYTYGRSILHSHDPLGSVRCLPSQIYLPRGDNAAQYIIGCNAGMVP